MSNEEEALKAMAEGAVKGLSDSKIINNLLEPASVQLGRTLGTLTKTINVALAPVSAMVWGYEKISTWLVDRLEYKLKDVPVENIVSPKALIIGPSIEAIKFLGEDEELREMFAQLIASSLNKDNAHCVHPGFVEILKNLSSEDAKVLDFIYRKGYCPFIELSAKNINDPGVHVPIKYLFSILYEEIDNLQSGGHVSIINLVRLGLIESLDLTKIDKTDYEKIRNSYVYNEIIDMGVKAKNPYDAVEGFYELTSLGRSFCEMCLPA